VRGIGSPYQNTYSVGYTDAEITVNYRSFPWSFAGISQNDFNNQIDPTHPYVYAQQRLSFSAEFITIPGTAVKFTTSGKTLLDRNWGFQSPIVTMSISLKYVPYIPAAAIVSALAAPINSVTYLGVPAGQLMILGADTDEVRMSDGSLTQTADYTFRFRAIAPWDYDFDGSTGLWDKVVTLGGSSILQRSDISTVIPSAFNM